MEVLLVIIMLEEEAVAKNKKAEDEVAKADAAEIEGLAAAVARAKLDADVLARAAAWLATAGASSVAQLETDDIDGALY